MNNPEYKPTSQRELRGICASAISGLERKYVPSCVFLVGASQYSVRLARVVHKIVNRLLSSLTSQSRRGQVKEYPTSKHGFDTLFSRALIVVGALSLGWTSPISKAEDTPKWRQMIQADLENHQLQAALEVVEQRLSENPGDLEAQAWHARILSWAGAWNQAQLEYEHLLQLVPDDLDIVAGLTDVLMWEGRPATALPLVEGALQRLPQEADLLLRRAKLLQMLGRNRESADAYRKVLGHNPDNPDARKGLLAIRSDSKHELRVGDDVDLLSYAPNGQAITVSIASRWNRWWSTQFATSAWQRFGQNAMKFSGTTSLRITGRDSLSFAAAGADDHGVIPHSEASFAYGHGFRFDDGFLRGYELSYQQGWLWYRDAHVLTVGATQVLYFPREWSWRVTFSGARTGFASSKIEWNPSALTQLQFPMAHVLTGQCFFAVGTEKFAEIDQIGHFSARTIGGGLRYRFSNNQDVGGYAAFQDRSLNQSQISFGLTYGLRF